MAQTITPSIGCYNARTDPNYLTPITAAEAMALTLCTAIQCARDCVDRGMDADSILPRFTFFFDVSISFFEEIAKFRAGRRIWARIARERFGAKDLRSWRFKFHSQTSGADLTRQQPLNNITRVAVQAMAGVFGGTQSMHADAYDEALTTPTEGPSLIAVNAQNILKDEAHLNEVIDPLGGSYYVETLTNDMERKIEAIIAQIDAAGGMYRAVDSGIVQTMIGDSALVFQEKVESGEQKIVGVNAYQVDEEDTAHSTPMRTDPKAVDDQLAVLKAFKAGRSPRETKLAIDAMVRACGNENENVFAAVVDAAAAGVTHGEICACLRKELGFGEPLVAA